MDFDKVKIEVYAPADSVGDLHEALSHAGAGRVGAYDNVCAMVEVSGCWRPLPGSKPFDGEVGKLSTAEECKLEMRCGVDTIPAALEAIRRTHPYEEPLINILPLLNGWFGVN